LLKKLLIGVAVVIALPIVLVVVLKWMRTHHDQPALVKGRMYRLRNLVVEMYGARAGDKVILFDAGIDDEGPALDALLGALQATRDDVTDVFLTHGHFDHVQASPLCKKARIHVGVADVAMLAGRARTEPFLPRTLSRWVWPPPRFEADAPYRGREELPLPDGTKVLAIPLPGHTPGSYLLVYDGVLIAGDSLQISDGKLTFADPYFSMDMEANRANVRALQVEGVEMVCTGHQGCIGDGQAKLAELSGRPLP
jgi:hydroxyacylglutathione hydrolase